MRLFGGKVHRLFLRLLLVLVFAFAARPAEAVEWATFGPTGGAGAFAIDPHNPRILYAAGHGSGLSLFAGSSLFKSSDEGANWALAGPQGSVPGNIRQIVADPHHPNHLYVTSVANGVFKSSDGGAAWTRLSSPDRWLDLGFFYNVTLDPGTPGVVYVGIWDWDFSLTGMLKSDDGGGTWTRITVNNRSGVPVQVHQVLVDPENSQVLYAVADYFTYQSTDGGSTWAEIAPFGVLVLHPESSDTLYLCTETALFRSADRGKSWERLLEANASLGVVINPHNPQTLYVLGGDARAHESRDGGATWRVMSRLLPDVIPTAWDPQDSRVVYRTDPGGLFKSKDSGATWRRSGSGLATSAVIAISVDPNSSLSVYAAVREFPDLSTQQHALFKSSDGGRRWERVSTIPPMSWVRGLVVNPRDGRVIYTCGAAGVYKSINAGLQWQPILPDRVATAFAVAPWNSGVLYAVATAYPQLANTLLESRDGGETWPVSHVTLPRGTVTSFAVGARESEGVFLGTRTGLYRSIDGGEVWTRIGPPVSQVSPAPVETPVESFALDPDDADRIIAIGGCRVIHSTSDGGKSWATTSFPSSAQMPFFGCVRNVRMDPLADNTAYAAAEFGLLKTIDGGRTWSHVKEFPQTAVVDVAFDKSVGKIYAGTPGAGVFATFESLESPRKPELSLQTSAYCPGQPWTLRVSRAQSDSPVGLYGVSNGLRWEVTSWRKTDSTGTAEAQGTFAAEDAGSHELWVEVDGAASNDVSFRLAAACP